MKDLLTGEEFKPKKASQTFASAENRIKYNNQRASIERHANSIIDKPLKKNKKILDELLSNTNEETFSQEYMLGKGFNYSVFNRAENFDGKTNCCVYEYIIINNNTLKTTKIIRDARFSNLLHR